MASFLKIRHISIKINANVFAKLFGIIFALFVIIKTTFWHKKVNKKTVGSDHCLQCNNP